METPFPFGFPRPTMAYLALYVVTLVIHVVFMSYVLAGTAYLGARGAIRRGEDSPLTIVLRDWMPLMLSAAITAGRPSDATDALVHENVKSVRYGQ